MDDTYIQTKRSRKFILTRMIPYIFFFFCLLGILIYNIFSAPINNKDVIIHISRDENLNSISKNLEKRNIVRHSFALKSLVFILNSDKNIEIGDYRFEKGRSSFYIAWQIAKSNHNIEKIKVTLPEGITNSDIVVILADKLSGFRKDLFISDIRYKEGYLFPDTYLFFPLSTTDEILDEISNNFNNKIIKIQNDGKLNESNINNIIIMASIIEKEAKGEKDAYIISGILWKRLKIGMPLQVDIAPITYKEKGLPEFPINNPGFTSILAANNPVESDYLYYLHDKNGQVHFATDYKEHLKNINNYLK